LGLSSTNGNGSVFASLAGDTGFYNTALALAMLLGRYLPMILVLALAGSFAAQRPVVADGSLRTDSALLSPLSLSGWSSSLSWLLDRSPKV
jgi:K+-transporting ATPase ATPase A chain